MVKVCLFFLALSGCLFLATGFAMIAAQIAAHGNADTANFVGFSGIGIAALMLAASTLRIIRE